jgi:hypothetical protein
MAEGREPGGEHAKGAQESPGRAWRSARLHVGRVAEPSLPRLESRGAEIPGWKSWAGSEVRDRAQVSGSASPRATKIRSSPRLPRRRERKSP